MAKVVSKIAAVFYELVAARVSRTIHGGRNAASVFHGLLESMLFRTFVPGKWHFRRDSMDGEPFCLQCESEECKIPAQKLAFRECLVVRFRETCYLVVSCVCRVKNVRNSMAKPRLLLFRGAKAPARVFLRGTCATQRFVVLSARSFDRIPFHIPSFFSRLQHRISMCVIGFRRLAKAFPYLRRKREVLSGHR